MIQGAFESFLLRNVQVDQAMQYLEYVLQQMQFSPMERVWFGNVLRGRSMWGSSGKAVLISGFVPFGSMLKDGNRYGAEFELQAWGPNIILRILFVPYMALWDQRDMFFLSQGLIEHITDNEHCRGFLGQFYSGMHQSGIKIEPYRGQY